MKFDLLNCSDDDASGRPSLPAAPGQSPKHNKRASAGAFGEVGDKVLNLDRGLFRYLIVCSMFLLFKHVFSKYLILNKIFMMQTIICHEVVNQGQGQVDMYKYGKGQENILHSLPE